jgi:hypothetical protein
MRSTRSWRGRWSCCDGACLMRPCTWKTRARVPARIPRCQGRFPSIGTGRSSAASAKSGPTRIRQVADQLTLPLAALAGDDLQLQPPTGPPALPTQPFDADALEYHFPTTVAAKLAIAEELGLPLMQLTPEDRAFIDHVLGATRMRRLVLRRIRDHCRAPPSGADHAG